MNNKWINVKDRLPEIIPSKPNNSRVLVCFDNGWIEVGIYVGKAENNKHLWAVNLDIEDNVAHWMPLPEKPNEMD